MREAKAWAIIATLVLAVVGLGWWLATRASSLRTTMAHANAQKVLLLHVGTEPSSLDPHQNRGIPESRILNCIFEGLVVPDPSDSAKQLPGVAERWEHNEDSQSGHFISGLMPDGPTVIRLRQTILLFLSSGSLPLSSAHSSPIICTSSAAAKISTKEKSKTLPK